MGGGNAEATWRRKLKPQTHDGWTAEGGPPPRRAERAGVEERDSTSSVEGDEGHTFFNIADGEVVVSKGGDAITTLKRGGYFGDRALVALARRRPRASALRGDVALARRLVAPPELP